MRQPINITEHFLYEIFNCYKSNHRHSLSRLSWITRVWWGTCIQIDLPIIMIMLAFACRQRNTLSLLVVRWSASPSPSSGNRLRCGHQWWPHREMTRSALSSPMVLRIVRSTRGTSSFYGWSEEADIRCQPLDWVSARISAIRQWRRRHYDDCGTHCCVISRRCLATMECSCIRLILDQHHFTTRRWLHSSISPILQYSTFWVYRSLPFQWEYPPKRMLQ